MDLMDLRNINASSPILVTTPSGMTTVLDFPRYFFNTPFSISKSVMGETGVGVLVLVLVLNAHLPRCMTLSGMLIAASASHV